MISEWDFRGGGYDVQTTWTGNSQSKKLSLSESRCQRFSAGSVYTSCKVILPYAPMLRTGGPIITFYQVSGYTAFSVREFTDTATVVTVPVKPGAWDVLVCVLYLVYNVGTNGTWRYYFRRGYSVS